jgi:hypothetical protein
MTFETATTFVTFWFVTSLKRSILSSPFQMYSLTTLCVYAFGYSFLFCRHIQLRHIYFTAVVALDNLIVWIEEYRMGQLTIFVIAT